MRTVNYFNSVGIIIMLCVCSETPADPMQAYTQGDYATAYQLWKPLALAGDADAQNYIGMLYYLGLGTEKDYHEAARWYELAARAGHPGAQRDLGLMYESGRLGQRDFEMAYLWLFAAYQQGNPNASQVLDMLAGQLSPNRVRVLKQKARLYIKNDVVDPEDDDY
jgi:TPR repeat protein